MDDRRVLFLGDSYVAGSHDPTGQGWVGRVAAASWAADAPLIAYNLGVGGQTSVQVAARWRAEAEPRLNREADCRVVFSFGANDATMEGGRPQVDPERTTETLRTVVVETLELGLAPFVVGPPPAGEHEHDERIEELASRFEKACAQQGVPFVPVTAALRASHAWVEEAARGDGWHPGAGGHQALADLVLAGGWLAWLRADPGGVNAQPVSA